MPESKKSVENHLITLPFKPEEYSNRVERVREEISEAKERTEALRKQGRESTKELKSLTRAVAAQKRQRERLAEILRESESGHERLKLERDEIGQKTNELNLKMAELNLSVVHLEGRISEKYGFPCGNWKGRGLLIFTGRRRRGGYLNFEQPLRGWGK